MMDAFFYQGDVPTAESLLDMAREVLVACEVKNELEEEVCLPMLDGLSRAWAAARDHETGEDSHDEPTHDSAHEAERAYHQAYTHHYKATIAKSFPDYDPGDEVGWWPNGMSQRRGWPVAFIAAVAVTLGRVEGAHSVAMYREMQRMDAAKESAGGAK